MSNGAMSFCNARKYTVVIEWNEYENKQLLHR